MSFGREKAKIISATGFSATTGFRVRDPAAMEDLLPVGSTVALLLRISAIPAADGVIMRRANAAGPPPTAGWDLMILTDGRIRGRIFGSAGSPVEFYGPRALTALDLNKFLLVLCTFRVSGVAETIYFQGQPGAAVTGGAFVYTSPTGSDLFFGVGDAAFADPATTLSIAQVVVAKFLMDDAHALDHFERSQGALRLEGIAGSSFRLDASDFDGQQSNIAGTLITSPEFGDRVRGAPIENMGLLDSPSVREDDASDFTNDWVQV